MMPADDGKSKSVNPDELARLLEIELIQNRAAWKQAAARHRAIRMVSFLFLFLVIAGVAVALYVVFAMRPTAAHPGPGAPAPASARP